MLNGSAFGLPPAPPPFGCSFRRLSDEGVGQGSYIIPIYIYIYVCIQSYKIVYHLNAILRKRGSQMCVTFLVAFD